MLTFLFRRKKEKAEVPSPTSQAYAPAMDVMTIFNLLAKIENFKNKNKLKKSFKLSRRRMTVKDGVIISRDSSTERKQQEIENAKTIEPYLFSETVSLDTAKYFFKKLEMNPVFAYNDYDNGYCYARTHLMCAELFNCGVIPQKVWLLNVHEKYKNKMRVKLGDREVIWGYHVAPALDVCMTDNKIQTMVLDTMLFDGPVTLPEWQKLATGETYVEVKKYNETCKGLFDYSTDTYITNSCDQSAADIVEKTLTSLTPYPKQRSAHKI